MICKRMKEKIKIIIEHYKNYINYLKDGRDCQIYQEH